MITSGRRAEGIRDENSETVGNDYRREHRDQRASCAESWPRRGYRVVTTGDASAVEEMIDALKPDLVLVDPYIGGEHRWDVVAGIKERNAHPCVLLCTVFTVADDNDPHFNLADGFVVKSSCTDDLILKVDTLLRRKDQGRLGC